MAHAVADAVLLGRLAPTPAATLLRQERVGYRCYNLTAHLVSAFFVSSDLNAGAIRVSPQLVSGSQPKALTCRSKRMCALFV